METIYLKLVLLVTLQVIARLKEIKIAKIALDRLGNNPVVLTRDALCAIYRVIKTGNR